MDINDYNHPLFNGDDVNLAEGKAGKIIVAGIEFVHAEGEDTGKPMGHLPVFTPQDGIGQGEPIYDYPSTVDVSLSLIPPNVINPYRIVLLAFLDMYYYQMAETAPGSLLFTNSAASVTLLNDVLGEFGVQERISASITIPALGVTNAVYPCTEPPPYYSLFFDNDIYGVVLAIGAAPPGAPRPAMLNIGNEYYSEYETLTETAAGSGVFTNASHSARLLQIAGQPRLAVSDGVFLTNTIFTVWETAPQSGEYRNYNAPILTDMSPDDLAMTDFTPWRLRITGASNTSLVEEVSIVTSVDSTNQITFTYVNGDLLSDQKFILIPDGPLAAPPPAGYVPIRINTLESKWWDEEQKDVTASMTLASGTRAPGVTLEKSVKSQLGAVVLRSLRWWGRPFQFTYPESRIAKRLEEMGYAVTRDYHATATRTLEEYIHGKQIWYSLSHGGTDGGKPRHPFMGLIFLNGKYITKDNLPSGLDYRLVLADGCCTGSTGAPRRSVALTNLNVSANVKAFAGKFGSDVAYVGWAWEMYAGWAQYYTGELLEQLKYNKSTGVARTVEQAHQEFVKVHTNPKTTDYLLMRTYGKTNNIIDLRAKGGGQ